MINNLKNKYTMVYDSFVTTTFDVKGYRIVEQLGVVRGIIVRSRSLAGNIVGGLQSLFGGNITIYTELCEKARVRYDANDIMSGITEVLCYGTAVKIEKE
jgi:uncharacterized protein YbjQ (UPF0145 family)